MRSIGIDLHKTYAYVFELDRDGAKKHYRVALTEDELTSFFRTLGQDAQVVMEASTGSFRFSEMVAQHAGRVAVSDPAQTRGALSQAVVNDHKAAETLARLLQSSFVREVWVPPAANRALRAQTALYQDLSRIRTQLINRLKSLLQQEFIDFRVGTLGPASHSFLNEQFKDQPELRFYLCSLARSINHLHSELTQLEYSLGAWCKQSEDAQLLLTIPGMGVILAITILAQIGDIKRFPTAARLCSYAGLVPRVYESGKTRHYGHISRAGRSAMRWALTLAAWRGSGRAKAIDDFKRRLSERRPKMVASTAAARKLLAVIWSMLTHRKPFRDEDPALSARKRLSLKAWPEPDNQALEVPKIKDRRPSTRPPKGKEENQPDSSFPVCALTGVVPGF